jgi:hypothetical protein
MNERMRLITGRNRDNVEGMGRAGLPHRQDREVDAGLSQVQCAGASPQ